MKCAKEHYNQLTCPYVSDIIEYKEVPWYPSGTRVVPCHDYRCNSKIGCIMEDNSMNKITKLPKFMPGQVIDLSYKNKGLPNRLLIESVFIREQDNQWMYRAYLENVGEYTVLEESFISSNMTAKATQVYKCAEIIKLYSDGWRFCGNFSKEEAFSLAAKYATNKYIKNIILRHALNPKGCLVNDKHGIWIKYQTTINDYGIINTDDTDTDVIVVK